MATRYGQRSFNGGIFSPEVYSRDDYEKRATGVKDAVNMLVRVEGAIDNRPGTRVIGGFDATDNLGNPPFLIPFQFSSTDTYQLEFSGGKMRVLKNGAYVLDAASAGLASLTVANPGVLVAGAPISVPVGTLGYVSDPNGTCRLHETIVRVTGTSGANISFEIIGNTTIDNSGGAWGTIGAGATITVVYELDSPHIVGVDLNTVQFVQDIDRVFFAGFGSVWQLTRAGDALWAWSDIGGALDPSIGTTTAVTATSSAAGSSNKYAYLVVAVSDTSEGYARQSNTVTNDLTVVGSYNKIGWPAVTGATYYDVYKIVDTNPSPGYDLRIGFIARISATATPTFSDTNIEPDYTKSPISRVRTFTAVGDAPSVASYVEGRLALAATPDNPQAMFLSTATDPATFTQHPYPTDDDAIALRMRAQKLDKIVAIIPLNPTVVFTRSAELTVAGGDNKGYLAGGNAIIKPVSFRGSADYPQPLLIDQTVLHVRATRRAITEVRSNEVPRDLTVLVKHLFKNRTITSWSYAHETSPMVWVVLDDGALLTLAYDADQQIWGWTRHIMGGTNAKVLQVSVVREGGYDAPYVVVERTLYGGTVRTVERIAERSFVTVADAYFVDCGLTYSGAPTTTLRGLVHLRGEAVAVLADGNVVENLSVSDEGVLMLPAAYSTIQVGLPYSSYVTTLPLYAGILSGVGDSSPLEKNASELFITVANTRGLRAGIEGRALEEVNQYDGTGTAQAATTTFPLSAEGGWDVDLSIEVRQDYPLPMTITKIVPNFEQGDDG